MKHVSYLLTIEELRRELQIDRRTIYRWINEGMPYRQYFKFKRFDFDDCVKWLADRPELRGGSRKKKAG